MTEALREEVLKDSGHSKLKTKCLDMITKLRVEASLLNTKTGKVAVQHPATPPIIEEVLSDEEKNKPKPIPTLDENGQVRIEHGPEDIKEMMKLGTLKPRRRTSTLSGIFP